MSHKSDKLRLTRARALALGAIAFSIGAPVRANAQQAAAPAGSVTESVGDAALQSEEQNLAKQLANPVASLISVPFQFNYDRGLNTLDTGQRANLNIQPVIPFSLNPDWNLISRTILPVNWSENAAVGSGQILGTGDIVQSLFLSPAKPWNGIIWGVGPVALLPTGSSDIYSAHQWGAGPTAVVLDQRAMDGRRSRQPYLVVCPDRLSLAGRQRDLLQPFVSYTTPDAWTFTLQSESTYDWSAHQWQVPVSAIVSKVVKVGPQLMSFGGGLRYYATSPNGLANGLGARFIVTLLFPK